nr:hypothetical protein [candidate division Zixibacteria bacterium]
MNSEMDIMKMDERQRLGWMLANRAIIFVIFIVWVGLIVNEFVNNRVPYFLIIMIPVLALIRFLFIYVL